MNVKIMVGIYKKVKQLLKLVNQYSPFLNNIVPGLGTAIQSVGSIVDVGADGANSVYNDYTKAKQNDGKYGFADGVKSFFSPYVTPKVTAANALSKSYGELHPRVKLKEDDDY
jgi:hypothetical protein